MSVLPASLVEGLRVTATTPVSGGDIATAYRVDTPDGPLFVKTLADPRPGMFEREAAGLRALRTDFGVRWLLGEGGPHLNHSLLAAGLVDELFLTFAPKLVGSAGPTIVEGHPFSTPGGIELSLVNLSAVGSELFFRYRVGSAEY